MDSNGYDRLPADPAMLLSVVNMLLRDEYDSVEALCEDMGYERDDFLDYMKSKGWEYNLVGKKFW